MSAYWSQWSYAELMSMHGVELDEIDMDLEQDEPDMDLCQILVDVNRQCTCYGGCSRCLE